MTARPESIDGHEYVGTWQPSEQGPPLYSDCETCGEPRWAHKRLTKARRIDTVVPEA